MPSGSLAEEISKRRTFAIISHPDAGKTTLTEKLLLFGGAIQMAGTVKGRKATRHATSDWMRLEQQRGISVTSSVMQFPFDDCVVKTDCYAGFALRNRNDSPAFSFRKIVVFSHRTFSYGRRGYVAEKQSPLYPDHRFPPWPNEGSTPAIARTDC